MALPLEAVPSSFIRGKRSCHAFFWAQGKGAFHLSALKDNQCLFYKILPKQSAPSWEYPAFRFHIGNRSPD